MSGRGFTSIVNDSVDPEHPFALGVTTIVAVSTASVELIAVKLEISPLPVEVSVDELSIDVLSFVQAYVVPETLKVEVNATAVVLVFSQTTWLVIASTVGVGLTVIVNVSTEPVHDDGVDCG